MDNLFGDDEEILDIPMEEGEVETDAPVAPSVADITPKSNIDLFGHEDVEAALLNDFNRGRMPHAVILAGPEGIGKATLAYRLARFLLSQKEEGAGLFGEPEKPATLAIPTDHGVFRRVVSGGHADLRVIEREFDEKKGKMKKNISVDSVREAIPFLRKTAAEGSWRVVIVDGAEDFNANSQNGLLKILEEPPEKTCLILTTTQPGALLPTIRSRCRMVPMEPLSEDIVMKLLDRLTAGIGNDEKRILARLSEGSIGRALRFYKEEGIVLYKSLLKIVSTLPDLDLVGVHGLADTLAKSEDAYDTACEILLGWCQRIVRANARGLPLIDAVPGDAEIFRKLVATYSAGHFIETGDRLRALFSAVQHANLDKRQAVISAFLMLQKPGYAGLAA